MVPWQIAASLPHRKFTAVWSRLFRLTHPGNNKGAWTPDEDSLLMDAFGRLGPKWKAIGGLIGRLPESCRDRWRTVGATPGKNVGRWGKDEEACLCSAVAEYDKEVGLVRFCLALQHSPVLSKPSKLLVFDSLCSGWHVRCGILYL